MLTKSDIDWLKSEFLPSLAAAVKDQLAEKLDKISTSLDRLAGDVVDKRETQELHAKEHGDIDDRIHRIEKHLHLS